MKEVLRTGLALALTSSTLLAACSGQDTDPRKVDKTAPLTVVVDGGVQLYGAPYDIKKGWPQAKAGILKIGSKVVATCLVEARLPELSSVRVEGTPRDSLQSGWSALYSTQGDKDKTPTPIFNKTLEQLRSRVRKCEADPVAGSSGVNSIDITKARKSEVFYHEDGSRTYQVSGTGYEFADGNATDTCAEGQLLSSVDYRGLDVIVINNDYPEDACSDDRLTATDFEHHASPRR